MSALNCVETSIQPLRQCVPFVVAGCIAYHAFVLLLLVDGAPPDRRVAIHFFANTPVFALWILTLRHNRNHAYVFGMLAPAVQLVIFLINGGRLRLDDWMLINGSIVGLMLLPTAWISFQLESNPE